MNSGSKEKDEKKRVAGGVEDIQGGVNISSFLFSRKSLGGVHILNGKSQ